MYLVLFLVALSLSQFALAAPAAEPEADPQFGYYGRGYGYGGYGGYGRGYYGGYEHRYYGKRSADSEPEAQGGNPNALPPGYPQLSPPPVNQPIQTGGGDADDDYTNRKREADPAAEPQFGYYGRGYGYGGYGGYGRGYYGGYGHRYYGKRSAEAQQGGNPNAPPPGFPAPPPATPPPVNQPLGR